MRITLTAKIQILPSEEEAERLAETMRAYSGACNLASGRVFETRDLRLASLHDALYRELRERFSLKSQMAQSVLRTVVARYKAIRTSGHTWTRPSFRHPEYDLVWNRDYSMNGELFSVNTLGGRVKLAFRREGMERYLDGTWRFGTAKLVAKHGKWFLHVPMTKEAEEYAMADTQNVVGIDLGVNFLAASYDSDGAARFFSGKEVKHRRARYAKVRKELQKRGTPSARRRLKAMGSRENRWMRDVNHRVSKALVEACPPGTLFVLEDLAGVRSATERVRLKQRYVSVSWAFYDLRTKIEYKAALCGSKAIAVNPAYTSQACPKCGHTEKANRNKKKHRFRCRKCGYASNDDRIGAMNLHAKGIQYLDAVATGHDPLARGVCRPPHDATPPPGETRASKRQEAKATRTAGQSQAPSSNAVRR